MHPGDREESWERKKEELFRTLFYDHCVMSPVPEENESSVLSPPLRRISPPRLPGPTRYSPPRLPGPIRYSPLPPLVIEVEPNRHDEPEEYYTKLYKRMRIIYRRLFIEGQSDVPSELSDHSTHSNVTQIGTESITLQTDTQNASKHGSVNGESDESRTGSSDRENVMMEYETTNGSNNQSESSGDTMESESTNDSNNQSESIKSDMMELTNDSNNEGESALKRKSSDSDEIIESKKFKNSDCGSSSTSSMILSQVMVCTAQVHRDATDVITETAEIRRSDVARNSVINRDNLDEPALLEKRGAPDDTETPDIELMRSQRVHRSAGSSLTHVQDSSLREIIMDVFQPQMEELTPDESDLRRNSGNSYNNAQYFSRKGKNVSTQTDRISYNNENCRKQIFSRKGKNVSTQTDRVEINRHPLRDIFVGNPVIARLVYD